MKGSKYFHAFAFGCLLLAGAASAQTLRQVDVRGGSVTAPATHGDYLYVGTGQTLTTWNLVDPAQPALVGRNAPNGHGPIGGIAVVGNYLYATWYSSLDDGGITVFSLADPAHPQVVSEVGDYIVSDYKRPTALAAAGSHLFVGDADNGLVVLDASDPLHPTFVANTTDVLSFDSMFVDGNRLLTFGNGFIGRSVSVVDISDPSAPTVAGSAGIDLMYLRAILTHNYAIAVGNGLAIYDLSDPAHITQVFSASTDVATQALRHGDTLYLIGASGIQVWDFSTPSAPVLQNTVDIGAHVGFDVAQAADTPFGPLLLDKSTDSGLFLDATDPAHPVLAASFELPLGVAAHAAAFDATHAYFAQEDYGLASLDTSTLARVGQFRADLDDAPAARDFEDIAVDGTRAYLASWGYGVIIVDIADPEHPVELGRFEFPFASAIEAHGNRVYVSSTTNGGVFAVYDVADAANPQLLGAIQTSQTYDLTVRGNYAYLVDGPSFGDGGLRIVDVSDPAALSVVGQDATNCTTANGIDVSADGNTVYIACATDITYGNALQIFDASIKSAPLLIGGIALPGEGSLPDYNAPHSVVVDAGVAYVGNEYGVDEIDVSTPATPTWQFRHETGYSAFKVERAPDGRIFAFTHIGGTWVFAPTRDHIFSDGFDG